MNSNTYFFIKNKEGNIINLSTAYGKVTVGEVDFDKNNFMDVRQVLNLISYIRDIYNPNSAFYKLKDFYEGTSLIKRKYSTYSENVFTDIELFDSSFYPKILEFDKKVIKEYDDNQMITNAYDGIIIGETKNIVTYPIMLFEFFKKERYSRNDGSIIELKDTLTDLKIQSANLKERMDLNYYQSESYMASVCNLKTMDDAILVKLSSQNTVQIVDMLEDISLIPSFIFK